MAYRTRREARYVKLRQAGFLRFEARPLSKVLPRICPYFMDMIKGRRDMKGRAQKMGATEKQFEAQIKELYKTNGWLKRNRVGKIVADPWRMFRDAEDLWKAKFPQYDSPWMKRWKDWRNFQKKIERTLAKQRAT